MDNEAMGFVQTIKKAPQSDLGGFFYGALREKRGEISPAGVTDGSIHIPLIY